MTYTYEIFLKHAQIDNTAWHEFLCAVSAYFKQPAHWQIGIELRDQTLHYYLTSTETLPVSLGLIDFLLKPADRRNFDTLQTKSRGLYHNKCVDNFATIAQDLRRRQYQMDFALLDLYSWKTLLTGNIKIYYQHSSQYFSKQLFLFAPASFLSLDFIKYKSFLFKKFPKYLKIDKIRPLLQQSSEQALLAIDPFPYFDQALFLCHQDYEFAKHSLVLGSSGSGKSKFLASFIDKIYRTQPEQYKIVVIDPHDALYQDCADIESRAVIDFQDLENSIDLFQCQIADINAGVELMLTLFRSLINDNYNGRLERVLRYTVYLLIVAQKFSFLTLRRLLLDLEYRNATVAQYQSQLPPSVAHFFLTDFNELKSQNYNDAIAPIVAFIDEMQMVPVFDSETKPASLDNIVQTNFLNIFSLNRLKLGYKVTQAIAGLLMQQLFLLAQQRLDQHLIIIIDEVSIVENPILARFLAEMRKYNTSVILAGQYFSQISSDLRSAIFANVTNYYLFRVSRSDAEILTQNLKIKVEGSDSPDDALDLLTGLKHRECLVQVGTAQEILPLFKARTTDFTVQTNVPKNKVQKLDLLEQPFDFSNLQKFSPNQLPPKSPPQPENINNIFSSDENPPIDINTFIKTYSTSRKIKSGDKKC